MCSNGRLLWECASILLLPLKCEQVTEMVDSHEVMLRNGSGSSVISRLLRSSSPPLLRLGGSRKGSLFYMTTEAISLGVLTTFTGIIPMKK